MFDCLAVPAVGHLQVVARGLDNRRDVVARWFSAEQGAVGCGAESRRWQACGLQGPCQKGRRPRRSAHSRCLGGSGRRAQDYR